MTALYKSLDMSSKDYNYIKPLPTRRESLTERSGARKGAICEGCWFSLPLPTVIGYCIAI